MGAFFDFMDNPVASVPTPIRGDLTDFSNYPGFSDIGPWSLSGVASRLHRQQLQSTNPVADQTQQMANNPIYGQESPFQPPRQQPGMPAVIGGDDPMYNRGMSFGKGGFGGPGQLAGGPAGQPILGPGQQMPLPMMQDGGSVGQQPMPLPMMYNFAGGGDTGNNAPIQTGRPLPEPYQPNPLQGAPMTRPGQMAGGPAGQPILGGIVNQITNAAGNYVGGMFGGGGTRQNPVDFAKNLTTNIAGNLATQIANKPQQMGGGLKPQPRNYRAPVRSGGILRQRLR